MPTNECNSAPTFTRPLANLTAAAELRNHIRSLRADAARERDIAASTATRVQEALTRASDADRLADEFESLLSTGV